MKQETPHLIVPDPNPLLLAMEEEEVWQVKRVKITSLFLELLKLKHIFQSSSEEVNQVTDL